MRCYDHLGNEFKSKEKRAEYYGLNPATVRSRLLNGLSLEESLTMTTKEGHIKGGMKTKEKNGIRVTDPYGKEYLSIADMCAAYGISHSLYDHRLARGWSQEEALSPRRDKRIKCEDENGNEYESIRQLCRNLNVSYSTILSRVRDGMSLTEAMQEERWRRGIYECEDHLGNKYDTFIIMCREYGIKPDTVRSRFKKYGYTLEEALTAPVQKGRRRWTVVQA